MKRKSKNLNLIYKAVVLTMLSLAAVAVTKADLAKFGVEDEQGRLAEVTSVLSVSAAAPGGTYDAMIVVDISPGWHINSAYPNNEWLIPAEVQFDTIKASVTPHSLAYPAGFETELIGEMMSVYEGQLLIPFKVSIASGAATGEVTLPIRVTYQPCNNRECRAPVTDSSGLVIVVGEGGREVNSEIFAEVVTSDNSGSETTIKVAEQKNELQELVDKHGIWGYFLALGVAFLTGLLLSFSPCTYPMIPITVSVFGGQQRTVGRGFVLSLFYVGTMAIVYGLMGLVVSMVGGVFGAWLASTPVVIGIVVVFVIFSLSMFGLYELNVPSAIRQKLGAKASSSGGGVGGAILLGLIAALVVSPCVGPFVAGILLYVATSGSPLIGFLILFVFALGLGTLFVLIGTFSSAINSLPNSGEWMESVKKFFGFVLLLMALYFLETIISPVLTATLTGLLLLALAVFGGGLDRLTPESGMFLRLKKFVGIGAFIVAIYLLGGVIITQGLLLPPFSGLTSSGGSTSELIQWETGLAAGMERAKQAGKPVLIDTWATWCVNCKVLEKKTFGDESVAAEASRFVSIKVQLETAASEITKGFMARFGMKHYSLPTVLIVGSDGAVRHVIQGVIGPDEMLEKMRQVR